MKIEFSYEPNYPLDCASLLIRHLTLPELAETSYTSLSPISLYKEKFLQKHNLSPERLEPLIHPIEEISDYVIRGMKTPEERLRFFFEPRPEDRIEIGWFVAVMRYFEFDIHRVTDEMLHRILCLLILSSAQGSDISGVSSYPKDETALIDRLGQADCSEKTRWSALSLYHHIREYFDEASAILEEAETLLRQKKEIIDPYAKRCIDTLQNSISHRGADTFFQQLQLRTDAEYIHISPSVMRFEAVAIADISDLIPGQKKLDRIVYGVLVDALETLSEEYGATDENILSRIKALSDKRRLEILHLLKEKSLCGQDIADLLSITPATVSHHMNYLIDEHFVAIEKQGTRINYMLASEGIREFLQDLERNLLQ